MLKRMGRALRAAESGSVYHVLNRGNARRPLFFKEGDYAAFLRVLTEAHDKGEVVTGLFYVDTQRPTFLDLLNLVEEPLATLPESRVRPPKSALDEVMEELK